MPDTALQDTPSAKVIEHPASIPVAPKERRVIPWDEIKAEYESGQLSYRELSKKFGVSPGYIHNKAKALRWERDLTDAVRKRLAKKIQISAVKHSNARDDEITEKAAERAFQVVTLHQKDARRQRNVLSRLLLALQKWEKQAKASELMDPKQLKPFSEIARNASQALDKLVSIERAAYNIDESARRATKMMIELD